MALTLICGPFRPVLEEGFVARLRENPPGVGRRVGVVTASRGMGERLQRLLALDHGLSFFNLRFHTLHGFSMDVLQRAGGLLPQVNNDDFFHESLVEQILRDQGVSEDRANALAGAHRATLRDLVEAGVDGSSFREHFDDLSVPGATGLSRLLSLADLYRERLQQLKRVSSSDLARLAQDALEKDDALLSVYDSLIYYGFYDLNGAQADLFSTVAKATNVTLFFPHVKGRPEWDFAKRFLETNVRVGGAPAVYPEIPAEEEKNVRVISVSGERDEVWWVAREILRLRDENPSLLWEDIGVVARGVDPYVSLVPTIFKENAVPFSLADGGPLWRDAGVRLVLDILDLSAKGHDRDALQNVVESPSLSALVLSQAQRQEISSWLALAGPRAGLDWILAHGAKNFPTEELDLIPPPPPPSLLPFVSRFERWGPDELDTRALLQTVRTVVTEFLEKDFQQTAGVIALGDLLDRMEDLALVWEKQTPDNFLNRLREAVGRARLPGTGSVRGVRVMGAMDARGESFRGLFFLGLKEGVFPRSIREDPLLSDDLRRLLRDPGGYWILPKLEGYDEEKLLFSLMVSSAQEKIYFLYSRSGDEGRAEVPSIYLREWLRSRGLSLDDAERVPRPPLEKWESAPLVSEQEAGLCDLLLDRRGSVDPEIDSLRQRVLPLTQRGSPGSWDGVMDAPGETLPFPEVLALWKTKGLSPSAIESFSDCPFQFFMSKVVGLRFKPDFFEEGDLSPAGWGLIHHKILCAVYSSWIKALPKAEAVEGLVLAQTSSFFGDWMARSAGLYPLVARAVQKRVEENLVRFAVQDRHRLEVEGFRPVRLEWPVTGVLDGTDLRVSGRVDRVDENPNTQDRRLVDYKNTLKSKKLETRVDEGMEHQVPLYLELIGGAETIVGARLEYLSSGETDEMSGAFWRDRRTVLRDRYQGLFEKIKKGDYVIRPEEGWNGPCRWCGFSSVCRKSHGPSVARAQKVVTAQPS